MVNTFCKKYLKAEEAYFNIKHFTCSPDKASTDNLPPYFLSLACNSFTPEPQLPWLFFFR